MCLGNNPKKLLPKKSTAGPKLTSTTTKRTKKSTSPISEKSTQKDKSKLSRNSETTDRKDVSHKASISSVCSESIGSESNYPALAPKEDTDNSNNMESLLVDEGFRTALKDFRKANAPKKLIRAVANYSESGMLDQNMTVHAFRTLQRMSRCR